MINANELRIGNWIYQEDKDHPKRHFEICSGYDIEDFVDFPEQCEPIPLTPELLEACGFDKIAEAPDEYFFAKYNLRKQGGFISEPYYEFYIHGIDAKFSWIRNVKYVHELQNLFFALTGKELTVNLPSLSEKQ